MRVHGTSHGKRAISQYAYTTAALFLLGESNKREREIERGDRKEICIHNALMHAVASHRKRASGETDIFFREAASHQLRKRGGPLLLPSHRRAALPARCRLLTTLLSSVGIMCMCFFLGPIFFSSLGGMESFLQPCVFRAAVVPCVSTATVCVFACVRRLQRPRLQEGRRPQRLSRRVACGGQ